MKVLSVLLSGGLATAAILSRSESPRPYHRDLDDSKLVKDEYLVKLSSGHTLDNHFKVIGLDLSKECEIFRHMPRYNAYHARLNEETVHNLIRYDPGVDYVEHNHFLESPDAETVPMDEIESQSNELHERAELMNDLRKRDEPYKRFVLSTTHGWGRPYITAGKELDPDNGTAIQTSYYWDHGGQGVDIYIFDSGVDLNHVAFVHGVTPENFGDADNSPYTGGPAADKDGHGTHVASIALEIAPWAKIMNVKISCKRSDNDPESDCKQTTLGLINALEDVTAVHRKKLDNNPDGWTGSVINLSLGVFEGTQLVKDAIEDAALSGIPVAATAGNGDRPNAFAPCGFRGITICASAVNRRYKRGLGANYGKKVDVIAPGEGILGAKANTYNEWTYKTGTSMATPFLAGTMALYVGYEELNTNVPAVFFRVHANTITVNSLSGFNDATTTEFLNTGINNPRKQHGFPYAGTSPNAKLRLRDTTEEELNVNVKRDDDNDDPEPTTISIPDIAPAGATATHVSLSTDLPTGFSVLGSATADDGAVELTLSESGAATIDAVATITSNGDVISFTDSVTGTPTAIKTLFNSTG
ncbi:MAG: hypothetical protein Q9165_000995 [Trypethelium subeluteriae]